MPQAGREKRFFSLEKTLHALNVTEETLISAAENSGHYIAKRALCDPRIVLDYKELPEVEPKPEPELPKNQNRTFFGLAEAFKTLQLNIATLPDLMERDARLNPRQVEAAITICDIYL